MELFEIYHLNIVSVKIYGPKTNIHSDQFILFLLLLQGVSEIKITNDQQLAEIPGKFFNRMSSSIGLVTLVFVEAYLCLEMENDI